MSPGLRVGVFHGAPGMGAPLRVEVHLELVTVSEAKPTAEGGM